MPAAAPTFDPAPMGLRGECPVSFGAVSRDAGRRLEDIPGVKWTGREVQCSWDIAWLVARLLNRPEPPVPADAPLAPLLKGLDRYRALHLHEILRPYQKTMVEFLLRRGWGICADPPRSGKTLSLLAAAVALGARRVLVICTALGKWVWVQEIHRWLKESVVVLEGRKPGEAIHTCILCDGSGATPSGTRCGGCVAANGQSLGYRILRGVEDVRAAMEQLTFTLVNYDLFISQRAHDTVGKAFTRTDLPGQGTLVASVPFDLVLLDEIHRLRGRNTDLQRKGQSRRERVYAAIQHIPRAWGASATPRFSRDRDLWGPLQTLSGGLFGKTHDDFFSFDKRFCEGKMVSEGGHDYWDNSGAGPFTAELQKRLVYVMMKRPRALILGEMPPKTRQVIEVEVEQSPKLRARSAQGLANALRETAAMKAPFVVEHMLEVGIAAGEKVIIWTYLRKSAERIAEMMQKEIARKVNAHLRAQNPAVWCVHGEMDPRGRVEQAAKFREWPGAAAWVGTMDSANESISLRGATVEAFADLHWDPTPLLQAEDRPYEPGITRGLSILYFVARGTPDEHVRAVVIDKLAGEEKLYAGSGDTTGVRETLAGRQETVDEILNRLTAHLGDGT